MTASARTRALQAHACLAAVLVVVTAAGGFRGSTLNAVSDAFTLGFAVAAAAACVSTWQSCTGGDRRAWGLLAVGTTGWASAQLAWSLVGLLAPGTPVLGSGTWWLGYVALPVLSVPALVLLAGPRGSCRRRPLHLGLDVATVLCAMVVLAWVLALADVLRHDAGTVAQVYVWAAVVAATTALMVLTAERGVLRRSLRCTALGVLVITSSDLVYSGLAARGDYRPGGLTDTAYVAALLLVTWGALQAAQPSPAVPTSPRLDRLLLLLPYAPVVLAMGVVGVQLLRGRPLDGPVLPLTVALLTLALVRQALTLVHNVDLIDALAAREGELRRQAASDPLTGLGNRVLLHDRLGQALAARTAGTAADVSLLYVDLDDFKLINDTHGHESGDVVLQEVARRLVSVVRPDDLVVRLGGDEFAVLLAGCTDADAVAERVLEALAAPVLVGARRFLVGASVGLVDVEEAGETVGTLLSHADIALYVAKTSGKGRVAAVRGSDRALAARQVRLRELVARPDLAEFSVVYQPVVDLRDGRVRGVEALLRWTSPEVGRCRRTSSSRSRSGPARSACWAPTCCRPRSTTSPPGPGASPGTASPSASTSAPCSSRTTRCCSRRSPAWPGTGWRPTSWSSRSPSRRSSTTSTPPRPPSRCCAGPA